MPENATIFPAGVGGINGWIGGGSVPSTNSSPLTGTNDYWLPIWSGEVINAYDQYNIFEPMVCTETIESGTTKRFPITGTVGHKGRWGAGEELIGNSGTTVPGWFDISLDQRPMAAYFELDDIAQMITQWDYRSELARQAGLQLSYVRDKQIACMIAQAAFTTNRTPFSSDYAGMNVGDAASTLPPDPDFNYLGNRGSTVTTTQRTNAALKLLNYLEKYMVKLSEIDATLGEVYCAVTPQAFHDIRSLGIARVEADLGGGAGRPFFGGVAEAGGLGSPLSQNLFGLTETLEYMGVKIVKSNHLAQLDHATVYASAAANVVKTGFATTTGLAVNNATIPMVHDLGDTKYNFQWGVGVENNSEQRFDADGSGVVETADTFKPVKALIWQKSAVCSLRLQGMKVETVKDVRRGTFFTVASIMGGAGILRPELCGAIQGSYTV